MRRFKFYNGDAEAPPNTYPREIEALRYEVGDTKAGLSVAFLIEGTKETSRYSSFGVAGFWYVIDITDEAKP